MASARRFFFGSMIVVLICCIARSAIGDEVWQTNFEAAKAKAKAEHKLLLVDFSGSDWCPWCKKMKSDVFDKERFKVESRKNYILVNLDYPNGDILPAEVKRQNNELRKQYKVNVYPTICLMNPKGEIVARTGYLSGGPDEFMKNMSDFARTHREIVGLKKKLDHVEGLDRAKVLDHIVMDDEQNGVENDETAKYSAEIVSLDPNNSIGLKLKYQFRILMADAHHSSDERNLDEAQADFEKAAALPGLKGKGRQTAWFAEAQCDFDAQQFVRALACLKKARQADSNGPKVADIDKAMARYKPLADEKQAIVKLTADADGAQGLNRARALDRLVEEQVKFGEMLAAERHPQDIKKWSDEIIQLDADNAAGLKTKYRLRELLIDANKAIKSGEPKQARAAIDEARSLSDLSDDERAKIRETAGKLPQH